MNISLYHHVAELVRRVILMSTIALFCYSGSALAQSTEIQELRLKVESLIQEIEVLKKQVQELGSTKPVKVSKALKIQARKVAENPWHSLKVNISKAEVTSLLGKPGKIHKWKTGEAWYFPTPKGGEVDFDANDNVSGWLEP